MKYVIFCLEIIAIILWLLFGQKSLLAAIIGIIVIILILNYCIRCFTQGKAKQWISIYCFLYF